jgi:hypothetical protein
VRRALASLLPTGVAVLSSCVYAGGFHETFEYRAVPAAAVVAPAEAPPSATEVRYARDTARVVFRRRQAERTADFVDDASGGYALCLRSGRDYALLVFERRVFDEAISQAADDARILRSNADTVACRARGVAWVAV